MKKILLSILLLSIGLISFAQTRVNANEISPCTIGKMVSATEQKVYQIDATAFLNAPKSEENGSIDIKISLDNQEYDLTLVENTLLQNTPAYYTDENGVLRKDELHIKVYAGHLKNDSTKFVRLSIIDNQYIDGYINIGEDFLYLSSPQENNGKTSLYYGKNVIVPDSCGFLCGTPDPKNIEHDNITQMAAANQYDFNNTIRIMKIAADADYEFYQLGTTNTNERMISIINQAEGLYVNTFNIAFQVVYTHYFQNTNSPYPYTASLAQTGTAMLNLMKTYWDTNLSTIDRNVALLFTAKNAYMPNYDGFLLGQVYTIGGMTNKSTSYMLVTNAQVNIFLTLMHEMGHLCGGSHDDCQNNGNPTASVMCQDIKQNPPYFSNASITRIGNHIGSNDYLQKISILSGPSVMARNATVTYTTSTSIPNMLTWDTPTMDLLSTSGTSTTFKAVRDGGSFVRLRSVSGATIEKEIHIGAPVPEITGEHRVPNNQYATFRATCPPLANAKNFQWILNPVNGNTVYGANSEVLDVAFYNTGSYQVLVRASNTYGVGEYVSFGLNVINMSSYSSIAYPNPASQTLYVDFSSITEQQTQALSATRQQKNYLIRLFNIQGSLVRTAQSTGEQISIDVSNLLNGNYFLHINDGNAQKPIIQKIVINH